MANVRSLGRTSTTVDTITWTPIAAPIYGNAVNFIPRANGGAVKFRTDSADSTTEFTVNAGVQKTYNIPAGAHFGFVPNEVVIYAQAVTGTGPVDADWS